jgi:hypothetical protein
MIWLFERGDEVLRIETRVDNATGEYVLVSMWSESAPLVERFTAHAEYEARILALESQLASDHWIQVGSPTILSNGWRGPVTN